MPVTRAGMSRFIRRITDGVIAENQGKARGAGELRVAPFPSKYSRVRPPRPRARKSRHPLLKPNTRPPASDEEANVKIASFIRRVRAHALARLLTPIRFVHSLHDPARSRPQRIAPRQQACCVSQ